MCWSGCDIVVPTPTPPFSASLSEKLTQAEAARKDARRAAKARRQTIVLHVARIDLILQNDRHRGQAAQQRVDESAAALASAEAQRAELLVKVNDLSAQVSRVGALVFELI